jgi:hypothetical protein
MIQVRRAAESDSFVFEVVVCEGNGETHHHVTRKDVRATDVRLAYPGALSRAGLPVLARPGAKGINPATLRHRGDFALFPRVRAGKATLPFAVLIKVQPQGHACRMAWFISGDRRRLERRSSPTAALALDKPRALSDCKTLEATDPCSLRPPCVVIDPIASANLFQNH